MTIPCLYQPLCSSGAEAVRAYQGAADGKIIKHISKGLLDSHSNKHKHILRLCHELQYLSYYRNYFSWPLNFLCPPPTSWSFNFIFASSILTPFQMAAVKNGLRFAAIMAHSGPVSSIIVDLINVIQIMNTKWSVERERVTILNGWLMPRPRNYCPAHELVRRTSKARKYHKRISRPP